MKFTGRKELRIASLALVVIFTVAGCNSKSTGTASGSKSPGAHLKYSGATNRSLDASSADVSCSKTQTAVTNLYEVSIIDPSFGSPRTVGFSLEFETSDKSSFLQPHEYKSGTESKSSAEPQINMQATTSGDPNVHNDSYDAESAYAGGPAIGTYDVVMNSGGLGGTLSATLKPSTVGGSDLTVSGSWGCKTVRSTL